MKRSPTFNAAFVVIPAGVVVVTTAGGVAVAAGVILGGCVVAVLSGVFVSSGVSVTSGVLVASDVSCGASVTSGVSIPLPEGGDRGGTVIAQGTPEEVAKMPQSYTGIYIQKMLDKARE